MYTGDAARDRENGGAPARTDFTPQIEQLDNAIANLSRELERLKRRRKALSA